MDLEAFCYQLQGPPPDELPTHFTSEQLWVWYLGTAPDKT